MLTCKAYIIGSPSAVRAAFRKKDISFAPFAKEFVCSMDVLSPGAKKAYAESLYEAVIQTFSSTMHSRALEDMNAVALNEVARLLPDGEDAVPVADTWHWLRSVMTLSATTALFGRENNRSTLMRLLSIHTGKPGVNCEAEADEVSARR